jgi:hypothetical protein
MGSDRVYFQPPEGLLLQYPCIVYRRDNARTQYADNEPYRSTKRYIVTVIDRNPDSEFPDKVSRLPHCSRDRFFAAKDLNHDVFSIFF